MQTKPESYRLFIAIRIPEEVRTAIELAQTELRRALPQGAVRWTQRDQFHLTLRFLGDVDAQRTEELSDAVRRVCRDFPPFEVRAERIGFFPGPQLPRVVWVGVHDQRDQLQALQRAIQDATATFTTEPPEARFTGHVTLGRLKVIRRSEAEVLAKVVSGMTKRFFGEWRAGEVEIMRSELSSTGARHSRLAMAAFGEVNNFD